MSSRYSFLFTADLHLGFSAYSKDEREQDIYEGFKCIVQYAIDNEVDAVIIAGDLFHSLRPKNNTMAFCIGQLSRLREEGIKVLIVGGNHDTPKSTGVSSPLDVVDEVLEQRSACYLPAIVQFKDGCRVYLQPYVTNKQELMAGLCSVKVDPDVVNILVLHGAYGKFRMMQFDEVVIDESDMDVLKNRFDFICMGHYHGHWLDADGKVAYAGSPERLTFNEKDGPKGFYVLTVADGKVKVEDVPYQAREMLDLAPVDLMKTKGDPTDALLDAVKRADIKDKICRMKVDNVPALLYRALDFRALRKETASAMNFEFVFDIKEEKVEVGQDAEAKFNSIKDEWRAFVGGKDKEIIETGERYLERAEEESD